MLFQVLQIWGGGRGLTAELGMDLSNIDDKFQCIVHELRNDTDWVNLKRTILRAPQIIKQKLGTGDQHPDDEQFGALYSKFIHVEQQLRALEIEVTKHAFVVKLFMQHCIGISESFGKVFDPNMETISPQATAIEKFGMSFSLSQKLSAIKLKTQPNAELVLNNVKEPVTKLLSISKNIKRNIKEREFALLDMNKYTDHLATLKSKDTVTLTLKQEQNLVRYEKNMELSRITYERINDLFKRELPKFFELVSDFIKPLHIVLYYLQLTIHYQLLSLNEIPDEKLKLLSKETKMDPMVFSNHISEQYRKVHEPTVEEMNNLTIIRSTLENSLLKMSKLSNSADSEAEVPESVRTAFNYCFLKFSYKAEQDGDLTFEKGDKVKILDQRFNSDWWKGELNGEVGIFPKNYVTM